MAPSTKHVAVALLAASAAAAPTKVLTAAVPELAPAATMVPTIAFSIVIKEAIAKAHETKALKDLIHQDKYGKDGSHVARSASPDPQPEPMWPLLVPLFADLAHGNDKDSEEVKKFIDKFMKGSHMKVPEERAEKLGNGKQPEGVWEAIEATSQHGKLEK